MKAKWLVALQFDRKLIMNTVGGIGIEQDQVEQLKATALALSYDFVDKIGSADASKIGRLRELMAEDSTILINDSGTIFCSDLQNGRLRDYQELIKKMKAGEGNIKVVPPQQLDEARNKALAITSSGDVLNETEANEAAEQLTAYLSYANDRGASDVHMRLGKEGLVLNLRENGHLIKHPAMKVEYELGRRVFIHITNKGKDSMGGKSDLSTILNGGLENNIDDEKFRLRASFQPLTEGLKTGVDSSEVTIRILRPIGESTLSLKDLNLPPQIYPVIERCILQKTGGILIGGPTNSGKSVLAHAMLTLVDEERKINTLEDPVEIIDSRYRQTEVHADIESANMKANLKNMLRQDTDVVLVGEIRDEDTARTAAQVALNGHLLVTTLHVSSVLDIFPYLTKFLMLKPIQVASESFSTLWVCQRLATRVCPHCAIPYSSEPSGIRKAMADEIAQVHEFSTDGIKFRNVDGCEHCNKKGASGLSQRIPVIEYIEIDEQCRKFIIAQDMSGLREHLRENGWQSLAQHAAFLISKGLLDPKVATMEVGALGLSSTGKSRTYESHGDAKAANGIYAEIANGGRGA